MNTFKNISRNSAKWLILSTLVLCGCAKLPEWCGEAENFNFSTEACCGGNVYNPNKQECIGGTEIRDKPDISTPSKKYTIRFNANGGMVSPTSDTTSTDDRLATLPMPTRNGYSFNGWFTESTGGTEVDTSTVFTGNTTVYAQWTAIVYNITFNANGGTVSTTSGTTDTDGNLIGSLPTPTLSDYIFYGWFTESSGGSMVRNEYTVFSANDTIYAHWTGPGMPLTYGGQTYRTVIIGSRMWMAENLNIETANSQCYIDRPDSCAIYGRLYTWEAANSACPIGWHLPTMEEWTSLLMYANDNSDRGGVFTKLKSIRGWDSGNNGTDDYGFSALPGPTIYGRNTSPMPTFWWSSRSDKDDMAYMQTSWGYGVYYTNQKSEGLYVRCVYDINNYQGGIPWKVPVYTITFNPNNGSVSPTSGTTGKDGRLIMSSLPTPTRSGYLFDGWFTASTGGKAVTPMTVFNGNTTVYAHWTLSNICTSTATCKQVTIGTQTWMAENLNIATVDSWCYNNNPDSCARYGRLYTWEAAKTVCPNGWHLPTDKEFEILIDYVGGEDVAGKKLKSTSGWNRINSNGNGTDNYGFSALYGGQLRDEGTPYIDNGFWWSASLKEVLAGSTVYIYPLCLRLSSHYDKASISESTNGTTDDMGTGFYVRCVKNN